MADWDHDTALGRAGVFGTAASRAERLLRMGGSAISAALLTGVIVWGYKLAERQLHGVPVIAAPAGPARIAPQEPGGDLAEHQGLAVNRIAAVGEAEPTADMLRLAPKPPDLAPEDTASEALRIGLGSPLAAPEPVAAAAAAAVDRSVSPSEEMRATLQRPDQIAEPLPDGAAEPIFDPTAALIEAMAMLDPSEIVDPNTPGVVRSPWPRARPVERPAPVDSAESAGSARVDLETGTLVPGTPVAQIGSYTSREEAKAAWDQVAAEHGALFVGKGRIIQAAESGGLVFYRLRVEGFADKEEARRFCAAMQSGGQCVPALIR